MMYVLVIECIHNLLHFETLYVICLFMLIWIEQSEKYIDTK